MMRRASSASSRVVTCVPGSGKPFELVKVDLVSPISRARCVILAANSASLPAMPSARTMQASLADWMIMPCKQIVDADFAVQDREHGRRARRRAAFAPGIFAHREFVGELELIGLDEMEDVFRRHQLGEAGRKNQFVGIAFEQHAAVLGVDQHGMRRADRRFVLARLALLGGQAGTGLVGKARGRPVRRRRGKGRTRSRRPASLPRARSGHLKHPQRHRSTFPAVNRTVPHRCGIVRRRCGGKLRLSKGRGRS